MFRKAVGHKVMQEGALRCSGLTLPMVSSAPWGTLRLSHRGWGLPSSSTGNAAPHTATVADAWNLSLGPVTAASLLYFCHRSVSAGSLASLAGCIDAGDAMPHECSLIQCIEINNLLWLAQKHSVRCSTAQRKFMLCSLRRERTFPLAFQRIRCQDNGPGQCW